MGKKKKAEKNKKVKKDKKSKPPKLPIVKLPESINVLLLEDDVRDGIYAETTVDFLEGSTAIEGDNGDYVAVYHFGGFYKIEKSKPHLHFAENEVAVDLSNTIFEVKDESDDDYRDPWPDEQFN